MVRDEYRGRKLLEAMRALQERKTPGPGPVADKQASLVLGLSKLCRWTFLVNTKSAPTEIDSCLKSASISPRGLNAIRLGIRKSCRRVKRLKIKSFEMACLEDG